MRNGDSLLLAAERIADLLADRGIDAVVIGAAALADHRHIRSTEDISLGVNVAVRDLGEIADGQREAGYRVAVWEPDGQDPLGHLIALKLYAGGMKSKADTVELLKRNPDADRGGIREL